MGCYHPPNRRKVREKNGKCNQYDFLQILTKFSRTTFKAICETLSALGACYVIIFGGVVNKKSMILEGFWEYLHEFFYIFSCNRFLARSYTVFVIRVKIFIADALVSLETSLKSPNLAVFLRFLTSFELSVLARAFSLGHWFFY